MLETIYEVDEGVSAKDDSLESTVKRFRLPYYICWCMIGGCFLIVTLIIAISLNPLYLSATTITKTSKNIVNVPLNTDDKLKISTEIISHLDNFSKQINEELGLQPNKIEFLTSTISNSSLEYQNQDDPLLWIYLHLKYPQSCIDNIQCKENFHSKLRKSFMKLSNLLTMVNLDDYNNKEIQLDWCNLIENSTTALLVSLLSITMINQSAIEAAMIFERSICETIDQNILLSKTIPNIIQNVDPITTIPIPMILDDEKLISTMRETHSTNFKKEEEINLTCTNPAGCSTYNDGIDNQRKQTSDYPNGRGTYFYLAWNSI